MLLETSHLFAKVANQQHSVRLQGVQSSKVVIVPQLVNISHHSHSCDAYDERGVYYC